MFDKKDFVDLQKLIQPNLIMYAHLDKKGNQELLTEHIKRCQEYFLKLSETKEGEKSFSYMMASIFRDISVPGRKLCERMIFNVVTFHDIGKCNPLFQSQKMKNQILKDLIPFASLRTNHSILSAILYIDYFHENLKKIKEQISNDEYKRLRHILFLGAYVIARHHSDFGKFEDFLEDFYEDGNAYYAIAVMEEAGEQIFTHQIRIRTKNMDKICRYIKKTISLFTCDEAIVLYTYERLLYSLLVAADYYATTEFYDGIKITQFGDMSEMDEFYQVYQSTEINRNIRNYEKTGYRRIKRSLEQVTDINILRNELFLDAERDLQIQKEENIFYLESPTGSGKSNVAFNLAFQLRRDNGLGKLFYVYPLNTLVEQNRNTLQRIFENHNKLNEKITVINSITPIKHKTVSVQEEDNNYLYEESLLNRQFLNYPIILTTNVSLFHMMFDNKQDNIFAFHQLANSILVLDEIQNYKNLIWTEIIRFFHVFAKMLRMKIIIMSATLPHLNKLIGTEQPMASLTKNREKFYSHPLFKNRVQLDFHLLEEKEIEEVLFMHVVKASKKKKKILMEFIKKKSAEKFYERLMAAYHNRDIEINVQLMTGDNNAIERARILEMIKQPEADDNGIILVATQVVEAGMDIDMDIGYKDISKLDSEEQFLGRINRSCLKEGKVYFFNLDEMQHIYKNDFRTNQEFTIISKSMRELLIQKDFSSYYEEILGQLIKLNKQKNQDNVENFFKETVGYLDFISIKKKMELIVEENRSISVYLARTLETLNGDILDGNRLWYKYKEVLQNKKMGYAKKQVILSEITSKMNYFIYQIKKGSDILWNDRIGELYFIENGADFFEDGKLCREKLEERGGLFLD